MDLREKGLLGEETQNWAVWRQLVRQTDGSRSRLPSKPKIILANLAKLDTFLLAKSIFF